MLYVPRTGQAFTSDNAPAAISSEYGTSITCGGSAHTKGAFSAGQLIASTAFDACGITVILGNVGTAATTNTRMLVDIGIGGSGSEVVLIPNLLAGQAGAGNSASIGPGIYYFPICIPAGSRLSARAQSVTASDTVNVQVHLHHHSQGAGRWFGQRVTAYGADEAASSGTSHTHGNASYAASTQLSAAIANPIRFMQLGVDLLTDTTGNTKRGLIRIAAGGSTNYVVNNLPFRESTTLETMDFVYANFILGQMNFNIPAGSYLGVGAQMNTTGEARGFVIYGVD